MGNHSDTLEELHDVRDEARGLINRRAVTAGPRGNDHLLFLNSSHLANWEHLRAAELKPASGSALDNQWPCPSRGRMGERAPGPNFQDKEIGNTFAEDN